VDILISQYQWDRRYVIWGISLSGGLKHIASIRNRLTGENSIMKRMQDKMLTEMAELQAEYRPIDNG